MSNELIFAYSSFKVMYWMPRQGGHRGARTKKHPSLNRRAWTEFEIPLLSLSPHINITEHLASGMTVLLHQSCCFVFSSLSVATFVCKVLERCRLQKRLSCCPAAPDSAVEHSSESDTVPQTDGGPEEEEDDEAARRSAGNQTPVKEQDLQAQVRVLHKLLRRIVVHARKHLCHDITGRNPQNTRLNALALNWYMPSDSMKGDMESNFSFYRHPFHFQTIWNKCWYKFLKIILE